MIINDISQSQLMRYFYNYLCFVNDISQNQLVKYFCGTSETSDTGNTANSSDASETTTSEGQLSNYLLWVRFRTSEGPVKQSSQIKWPTIGTHSATKIYHCYRFVQKKLKVCYQSLVRIFTISIYLFLATGCNNVFFVYKYGKICIFGCAEYGQVGCP